MKRGGTAYCATLCLASKRYAVLGLELSVSQTEYDDLDVN